MFATQSDEYTRKLYERKEYTIATMACATSCSPIVTVGTKPEDIITRLFDALIVVMQNKNFWQSTAIELLAIIGTSR